MYSFNDKKNIRPLIFGEVLFDVFEDNESHLGGAAFNVAWHLHGFGVHPLFISKVGDDDRGKTILDTMQKRGMDLSGIQTDPDHPTGMVSVRSANSSPVFDICADQAYDYIEFSPFLRSLDPVSFPLLYHGSLALRNETSNQTFTSLSSLLDPSLFFDVNLRAPWWNQCSIEKFLHGATAVKLNLEELAQLTGIKPELSHDASTEALELYKKYSVSFLCVTMGEKGSLLVDRTGSTIYFDAVELENPVDTVGAGDAFAAVLMLGMLKNWPLPETMRRASEFAAVICTVRGALLQDTNIYSSLLKRWESGTKN